jgi:hypothetical protein
MSKQRRVRWWFLAALIVAVLSALALTLPIPPLGKFQMEGLSGADGCWQFTKGRVILWEYPWNESNEITKTNFTREDVGTYRKEDGQWFWFDARGRRDCRIETTLFVLTMSNTNGTWSKSVRRWWWP